MPNRIPPISTAIAMNSRVQLNSLTTAKTSSSATRGDVRCCRLVGGIISESAGTAHGSEDVAASHSTRGLLLFLLRRRRLLLLIRRRLLLLVLVPAEDILEQAAEIVGVLLSA